MSRKKSYEKYEMDENVNLRPNKWRLQNLAGVLTLNICRRHSQVLRYSGFYCALAVND